MIFILTKMCISEASSTKIGLAEALLQSYKRETGPTTDPDGYLYRHATLPIQPAEHLDDTAVTIQTE